MIGLGGSLMIKPGVPFISHICNVKDTGEIVVLIDNTLMMVKYQTKINTEPKTNMRLYAVPSKIDGLKVTATYVAVLDQWDESLDKKYGILLD
jgi:hypothetical protein